MWLRVRRYALSRLIVDFVRCSYFLDLMWSQSLALILPPIAVEFGTPADQQTNIFTAANTGLTVGALFWGLSVDIIGQVSRHCTFTCASTPMVPTVHP